MKAGKTNTWDWVRLRLNDGQMKANLTWGRSGDTISGTVLNDNALGQSLARAWSRYRDSKQIIGSLGDRLDVAFRAAETCATIAEFVMWLERASGKEN